MRKAWIAISLTPVLVAIGCQEDPAPVTQVPAPVEYNDPGATSYPPVAIEPGTPSPGIDPGGQVSPTPATNPGSNPGANAGIPQVGGGNTYTVRDGDTLWAIASRVYGDGQRWVDIAQANPSLDPQRMAVGQVIQLP